MTSDLKRGGSIARFHCDLAPERTLYGYAAEPAAERRQLDRVHERMYGARTESPRTPYICVWRDPKRFSAVEGDGPPEQILLACSFGATDWEPPLDMLQEAMDRQHRPEGLLSANWERHGDSYRLTRIHFEIRGPDSVEGFRSANAGDDFSMLRFRDLDIRFPESVVQPLRFRIEASVPYRLNSGGPAREPTVTFAAEGYALPIPPWLMY